MHALGREQTWSFHCGDGTCASLYQAPAHATAAPQLHARSKARLSHHRMPVSSGTFSRESFVSTAKAAQADLGGQRHITDECKPAKYRQHDLIRDQLLEK